jgi:hypothetical protein
MWQLALCGTRKIIEFPSELGEQGGNGFPPLNNEAADIS